MFLKKKDITSTKYASRQTSDSRNNKGYSLTSLVLLFSRISQVFRIAGVCGLDKNS